MRGRLRRLGANFCVDLALRNSRSFGPGPYVPVVGSARGVTFHTTLVPRGNGAYRVFLNGSVREAAGLVEGDTVDLELAPDPAPPEPSPPVELLTALEAVDGGIEAFFSLPDGLRREALRFVANAQRAATRERRVARILEVVEERALQRDRDLPR